MPAVEPDAADAAVDDDETGPAMDVVEFVTEDAEPSPDDGDEYDERIDLVRTGLIRVWLGGKRYRLRRPFFGEFRKIRLSLQDVNDEIADASDAALLVSRQMSAEEKDHDPNAMPPEEWATWRKSQRTMQRGAQSSLTDRAEEARLQWWDDTWDLLTLDGRPDDWPAWITDPNLANRIVTHWRSSPLGRG